MKAVFLDRDGVICEDSGYISTVEKVIFIPDLFEGLRKIIKAGFQLFIVSNQSGVARGFFSESSVWKIDKFIKSELLKKNIFITRSYYCFHHPQATGECLCRKPKTGLFFQAAREYNLKLNSSGIIGDKISDIQAGFSLNMWSILIKSKKYKISQTKIEDYPPSFIAETLSEAAEWIARTRL